MGKYQSYRNSLSAFISSERGQHFFNFAYSIGAAIVIWGALFKILHLPGGNMLLSIGMGTEVLMFILTAFDRPAKEYHWERVYPQLLDSEAQEPEAVQPTVAASPAHPSVTAGIPTNIDLSDPDSRMAELTSATQRYLDQMAAIATEMQHLHETTAALNNVSTVLLESYKAITENSEDITRSSKGYVEQMQDLNRNISGLNTIYEIQLRGVSSQIDSIDRVNRGIKDIRDMYEKSASQSEHYCQETEKMTRYMQQLNAVYEKMLKAMTVNMYRPMPGAADVNNDSNN